MSRLAVGRIVRPLYSSHRDPLVVTDETYPGMGNRFVITRPARHEGPSEVWHERDLDGGES